MKEKNTIKTLSDLELMCYYGSLDHKVDKEKFKKALKDNVKRYKTLPQSTHFPIENRWNANNYSEFKNKTTAHEYLEIYLSEPAQGNFDVLLLIKHALLSKPTTTTIKGDITTNRWAKSKKKKPEKGYYFFHGDVHIEG